MSDFQRFYSSVKKFLTGMAYSSRKVKISELVTIFCHTVKLSSTTQWPAALTTIKTVLPAFVFYDGNLCLVFDLLWFGGN
jgi:hypothetical protein